MFEAMDFGLLFDANRQLLSIGYRVGEGSLDESYYDLLASEARLASFVAIAKGDVPTRHWFHLGRTVTSVHSGVALVSWSGSMFEYLMPHLVMRPAPGSLLDVTNRNIVRRQREYGAERGLPGAFRNPPITRGIWTSHTSIQALAFPVSGSSVPLPIMSSSLLTPLPWRR